MQYFIDTNIFLRVIFADNSRQYLESANFLSALKENKIEAYTSTVVLSEIVWTMGSLYKFSKDIIIRRLKGIINLSGLKIIDKYNHKFALELYQKYSIKYIDTLIASIIPVLLKEMTVVTYDRDFRKLPILSFTPYEVFKKEKLHN